MAKTIGPVFNDSDVSSAVNFTFFPLPGGPGLGCAAADNADACALSAAGCESGCTGENAAALAAFSSCYEGTFKEVVSPRVLPRAPARSWLRPCLGFAAQRGSQHNGRRPADAVFGCSAQGQGLRQVRGN